MKQVINNIKALRLAKGLTQKQLAEMLGITTQGYQKIESGENDLNLSRLAQIADVHGVSVVSLFEGTDKANKETLERLENRIKELERENSLLEREKAVLEDDYEIAGVTLVDLYKLFKKIIKDDNDKIELIRLLDRNKRLVKLLMSYKTAVNDEKTENNDLKLD